MGLGQLIGLPYKKMIVTDSDFNAFSIQYACADPLPFCPSIGWFCMSSSPHDRKENIESNGDDEHIDVSDVAT